MIQAIIKDKYKQSRKEDDRNQELSVQPWGEDGDKKRYWLIRGNDDSPFRVYKESPKTVKTNKWYSIAGTVDELRALAQPLSEDRSQAARRLGANMLNAIPMFEASEEVRSESCVLQARADFRARSASARSIDNPDAPLL